MGINVKRTISMDLRHQLGPRVALRSGVALTLPVLKPTTGSHAWHQRRLPPQCSAASAPFPGLSLGGWLLGIVEAMAQAYISTQLSNAILFAGCCGASG